MPNRSNKHIKKFNQLVEVYDPVGVASIEKVSSQKRDYLENRRAELSDYRAQIEALGAAEFFNAERKAEIRDTESLPDPAAVAQSQREEMLDRLDLIEQALTDAIDGGDILDTADDLDL